MKLWKILSLFLAGLLAFFVASYIGAHVFSSGTLPQQKARLTNALASPYSESCLTPTQANRPTWECYEISVDSPEHQTVMVRHTESGEQYRVLTFLSDDQAKFRFTPTRKGLWTFSTGGQIDINAERGRYAKGFVAAEGSKWIRSATGEAFVPQFVMYNKPDLEAGLEEFVDGHGFTGFHIRTLRDFLDNPDYFEAAVLKTYRRGGTTHFWIWGDEQRNTTPSTYGVDVDRLYTEIAARLGPLPGWTLGFGFDLFEWTSAEELEDFRDLLRSKCDYAHMIGGRGHKNEYREISTQLDYASWEWHHPSYQDYREHLVQANLPQANREKADPPLANYERPVFSEDRFRIQVPDTPQHYTAEETIRGLWHSAMAGGIANIWGHRPEGQIFSEPYPNKAAIRTYSEFISAHFNVDMEPDNSLIDQGYCLRARDKAAICYSQMPETVRFDLSKLATPVQSMIAIDAQASETKADETKADDKEIEIPLSGSVLEWQPPYRTDWAFWIGD